MVGICEENDIATFMNVRERLFRPHYSSNDKSPHPVTFMEETEQDEICFDHEINLLDHLVTPLSSVSSLDPNLSSVPNPTIRVAAFASTSFFNIDQNKVMNHFTDAIMNDLSQNELGPPKVLSLVANESLQKELIETAPIMATNQSFMLENDVDDFDLSEFFVEKETNNDDNFSTPDFDAILGP